MIDIWSEEYLIDQIEMKIKHEIDMYFYVKNDRKPNKKEYESIFADWVRKLKCEVTPYDLGIYE